MLRATVAAGWVIVAVAGLLVATAWDADADPITVNLPSVVLDAHPGSMHAPARRPRTPRRIGRGARRLRLVVGMMLPRFAGRPLPIAGAPDWLPTVAPARGP